MSGHTQIFTSNRDPAAATAFASRRQGKRILLVEDEPLTRAILLTQLRLAGLDVETAANGDLALKKIPGGQLDAMVLELILPDMSGLAVIEEARRDPDFGGRPIYVYTSASPAGGLVRGAARAEGTKVFNKLSIPVDALVSEMARDLVDRNAAAELPLAVPTDPATSQVLQGIPARLHERVAWLCKHLRLVGPSPDPDLQAARLGKLRSKAHALVSSAAAAGLADLACEAAVLRAFLTEVCEKPKRFTDSSSHTLASAAEALELLVRTPAPVPAPATTELMVVVVDDELFSRTAVSNALRSAGLKLITFADPTQALEHLTTHSADLVVLDVLMPKLNGPGLREKLRALPHHSQTPVLFVASLQDLKHSGCTLSPHSGELVVKPAGPGIAHKSLGLLLRCLPSRGDQQSANVPSAGAAALMVKPFISMELALKALSMIMKKRNPASASDTSDPTQDHTSLKPAAPSPDTGIWLSIKSARAAALGSKTDPVPSPPDVTPSDPVNALLSCPDAGVIEIDKDRRIIYSSDLCAAMFGWQKLLGQHVGILLKGGLDNDFGRILLQSQSAGHGSQRYSLNVMARRKDDTEFPASVILTRISTPSKSSWTAVFRIPVSNAEGEGHTNLRTAHQELQKTHEDLKTAHDQLQKQYQAAAAEAAVHRETLAKGQKERQRLEQHLQDISSAKADLEKQIADLTQEKDDLQKSCLQLRSQLQETSATLEVAKTERQRQAAEHERAEVTWREQLHTAKTNAQQAEAAWQQECQRTKQLEQELASSRLSGNDLQNKAASQQQAAADALRRNQELENQLRETTNTLQNTKADLQRQIAQHERAESDWLSQLNAATVAAGHAESARAQESERTKQLEQDLAALRQSNNDRGTKLAAEQQAAAESKNRIQELENQLQQTTNTLEKTKADLQRQIAERGQCELEWREQLHTAQTTAQQAESAWLEEGERCKRLEQELAGLRQAGDGLKDKLAAEQQAAAEARRRSEELENRLRESADEMARVKAEWQKQARVESDQRDVAGKSDQLQTELRRLRETEAAHEAEIAGLENRLREGVGSLARVTADLETERGERRRLEQRSASLSTQLQDLHGELKQHLESEKTTRARISDLDQRLREREEAMSRLRSDLQKETADRHLAEEQLRAAGDMGAELRKYLSLFEEAKKAFKRSQDELEGRLQNSLAVSRDLDARLQKELTERQRVEEALATAQRRLQEDSERASLDLARLQSELQVEQFERTRLEGDAVHSRYASLDSARVGRTLVNSLRRQIRQPVDKLMQSTRSLLEGDLPDEQKKLVESMLESTLLLQTTLLEAAAPPADAAPSEGEGNPPEQVNQAA